MDAPGGKAVTRTELMRIVDRMGRLWPASGLVDAERVDPKTLEVWLDLLRELPAREVRDAVDELAREGERFVPAPPVVYHRAQVLLAARRPALVAPDATRDLTPDELAALPRNRALLRTAVDALMARGWPTTREGPR